MPNNYRRKFLQITQATTSSFQSQNMEDNTFDPNWAMPPSATIQEAMKERDWTITTLAEKMGYTEDYVTDLLNNKIAIDRCDAETLEVVFDVKAEFWLKRESTYRTFLVQFYEERKALIASLPDLPEGQTIAIVGSPNDLTSLAQEIKQEVVIVRPKLDAADILLPSPISAELPNKRRKSKKRGRRGDIKN
ncbi:MAG: helix-turn-helix domain-containing protein [Bacteroidota bacterium]